MTKLVKGFSIAVVAVTLLVGAAVSTADAITQSEADAIIAALGLTGSSADVINALVTGGSSSSSSCALTTSPDLTIGSTGANVVELQKMLVSGGYLVMPAGVSMGYFGSLTQSALASYQAAMGISPAAGYFGPVTRASISCSSSSTGSTGSSSSTGLSGGAGSVDTYELSSSYNNENVGEGEDDVEVLGLEVEVSDESDLQILAVKIDFDYEGTGGSDNFDDYAKDVSVWLNGDKVAEVDADEFNDDNNYSRTVALDDAVIEAGDTEDLVVAVSGANTIDSSDLADAANDWDVDIESVRFKDAQGTVISEDPGTGERAFEFESFADSADIEVRFSEDDKDINDAHVLDVDENDETTHSVLSFTIEVDGDDITMKDLDVEFDSSVGFNLQDGVSELRLLYEGEEVGSENMPAAAGTNEVITFDDLDLDLDEGDHDFLVEVELNASSTAGFADGDTIAANIGTSERQGSDLEDSNGDNIANADRKGSVTGEALAIFDNAIELTWVDSDGSESVTIDGNDNDRVELVLNFQVTNNGDETLYIPDVDTFTGSSTSETRTAPAVGEGVGYSIQFSGTSTVASASVSAILESSADKGSNAFEILEGDTEDFTLTVTVVNSAAQDLDGAKFKALLAGVGWADSDSATADSVFTYDLDGFESSFETIGD